MLTEWRTITHDRDNRVRRAVSAGVSKYRVNQLTGIGRSTIDPFLGRRVQPRRRPDQHRRPRTCLHRYPAPTA
jgi:hypothetical protein